MPEFTKHEPGTFCWVELATSDTDAAKRFYTRLFDWTFVEEPAGPDMVYTRFQKSGKDVGALYRIRPDQKGMPPNWMSYVTVASADAAAQTAKEFGGKTLMGPFDVKDLGRMAVIQDPTGAMFSVWEPHGSIGIQVAKEPGALIWNELHTNDTKKSASFYTKLFGWTPKRDDGEYTEFHRKDGAGIGGMIEIQKEWGPVPPNWLVYFATDDCDASAAKAQSLGASPIVPPSDIPEIGRFAILRDPQGAAFAIIKVTREQA